MTAIPSPFGTTPRKTPPPMRSDDERSAGDWLHAARERERLGSIPDAIAGYQAASMLAERSRDRPVLAESLRRLAVLRHHQNESDLARALCRRSCEVARSMGEHRLAAEALNTLGGISLATGNLDEARQLFLEALELAGDIQELGARVEQNLGVLANIQGQLDEALSRYQKSLDAYRAAGDDHGCAIAYNNLGMVSTDREGWQEASHYFRLAREIAARVGDFHLRGQTLVNQAEVDVCCQRFDEARQGADEALAAFDQIGAQDAKADAYRVLGMVYRETGRLALAESLLRSAMEVATDADSPLLRAEVGRELALLHQAMGRNREALVELNTARNLFLKLDARVDLVNVGGKVAEIEETYLAVVREWGRSIESADPATFGRCERVARTARAVAKVLGLGVAEQTTVVLGAYLHDVGMLKVPREILNKNGSLQQSERECLEMHPVWGVELLSGVDFPWDIKPIIRWHHERCDGTGYPDRLLAIEIPLSAQIVGISAAFDGMTTSRVGKPAMTRERALERVKQSAAWWSEAVVDAFLQAISGGDLSGPLLNPRCRKSPLTA